MKSTIRKSTYRAIYRLLDRVSPVPFDCGELCGCACCMPGESHDHTADQAEIHLEDEDSMGIYLLPGEEKIFTRCEDWLTWNYDDAEEYEFPDSWHGKVPFICCNTPPVCDRKMRPVQCRTYPVAPHLLSLDDTGTDTANSEGSSSLSEQLILILSDIDAPYICPLIEANSDTADDTVEGLHLKLDERFLKATYTVWKRLIKDPLIRDLVKLDSDERDFFIPVYPEF